MKGRNLAELAAVLAATAVWAYLGWDGALWDPRLQLLLHAGAFSAVGALAFMAWRGTALPRTRLELPVLVLVLAFGVATLLAQNRGLALPALAAILATVAMLPVCLLAIRYRPSATGLIVIVPVVLLAAGNLVSLLWRRAEWWIAGGSGLPPVRLGHEGSPFGSVAVAPFVLLALVPVTMLIADPRLRRWLQVALAVIGVPLTLLSGSRSAWLAMVVAAAILILPGLRRVRLRGLRTWRGRAAAAAGALLAIGGIAFIAPRLTDISSLIYRGYLWRDTLAAWAPHALFGIGPGTMPWARQAAAPALTFPVRQPHSHDVLLGILGDAGILGLAAAVVLFGCFVAIAGPWRTRTTIGRLAFAILVGFGVGSLFEDLTFLPNFNLLLMLLVAITLVDAGAVHWTTIHIRRRLVVPATAAVAALLLIALIADAAAIDYRLGVDTAAAGDWQLAQTTLQRAVDLDPWHPTGPKALAVAADWNGDLQTARGAAARAVELNAGDGASWTNLAIVCLQLADAPCAQAAAGHAVDEASLPGRELINAALVYERLGLPAQADRAYRLSLLTNYWTGLTTPWPRHLALESTATQEVSDLASELNTLIAHRVLGDPIAATSYQDPIVAALAYAMLGDRAVAEAALLRAQKASKGSPLTWEITALLEKHWGEDPSRALRLGDVTRGAPLAEGPSQIAFATFDIASFRGYPADGLVRSAVRLLPEQPWPWVLEPLLAPAG